MKRIRGRALVIPLLILTVAASVFLLRNLSLLQEAPFAFTHTWRTPSAVSVAPDGSMAVVENSKMMVSILDSRGDLRARIGGGSYDTDSYYYAEHVATDGESVVIAEVRHAVNSTFVQGERLLRYTMDGTRAEVLYEANYEGAARPRQLGYIRNVRLKDGQVIFTWIHDTTVGVTALEGGESRELLSCQMTDDRFQLAAYDPASGRLCFTTRKGRVGMVSAETPIEWLPYGDGQRVPWSVGIASDGLPILSELLGGTVDKTDGTAVQTLWSGGLVYELTVTDGRIVFSDGEAVHCLTDAGEELFTYQSVGIADEYAASIVLTWASAVFLGLVVLGLLVSLFRISRGQPVSEARRRMLIAAGSALVTVGLVMVFLFSFMSAQMQKETVGNLSELAESISATSATTLGARLEAIDDLSDYRNADYNAVRAYLDAFCDASYQNADNLYYVLFRFDETMLWGVMDYEDTTGVHYPYTELDGTVYQQVIQSGQCLQREGEADIYGMWSFAVAPVYNPEGKMVGLIEIGTNQYGDVVARNQLLRDTLTGVLVALMMAMLMINELTAFGDHRAQRRILRTEGQGRQSLGFLRALIFLVFMADNMDAAYIPQLSASLGAQSGGGLGVGLASALPMSLQLLMIGFSALLCGRVLDHRSPRAVMLGGLLLQLTGIGLSLIALQTGFFWYLAAAKAVGGLGTGASVVTCNALPARCEEEGEQRRLIAGLTVGLTTGVVLGSSVGGFIADYISYPAAYLGSALCVLGAGALMWPSLRGIRRITVLEEQSNLTPQRGATRRFLGQREVFGFLLFVMIPYMLMMYFKDYLFPLFASGLGKSESVIGSVMLLAGMLAIFLGDVLGNALLSRAAAWDIVRLSNLICVYALGLFALHPSFETAVVTLCLLGVSASFGYTTQGVYYTGLIRRYGISDGKAMGLYSLFDNLGQTSGPLGLSALLFLGVAMESGVIALGAAGLLALASVLSRNRRKKTAHGD